MSDANVGSIVATLSVDARAWQQGLQAASQQLQQFSQGLAQSTQQSGATAAQLLRVQSQAATQAAREAMQQARLQAQESMQSARLASQERIAAARQASAAEVLEFRRVTEAARQAFAEQREVARQAAPVAGGGLLAGALQVAGGLGIVTSLQGAIASLKDFAGAVVTAGMRLEQLRAQFTAFQGAQAATATLDSLFRTAQRLGVEFGPLANGFRQFMAATQGTVLEGARAERVFNQIVTGMRAMGASSDQVSRALVNLQQMISKGTVSQEELRQGLGDALPGALGIAARALGVTTQELNKMIEKGVEATGFVETFANQVEREFGGKAATATNTLASAWQRLANEFEQFKGALAASGLAENLRDIATWMTKILETWRQARAEQSRQLGGPAPTVPPELQGLSPAITARDREIARLRADITNRQDFGAMLGGVPIPGPTAEERRAQAEARIRQLQEQQRQDIARLQRQLLAEGAAPGATGPGPADTALANITRALEEGRERLRRMDVAGELLPSLDAAKEKADEWRKVMDAVKAVLDTLPDPLLRSVLPAVQALLAPANRLAEALQADVDLAKDAAGEVSDMRQRVTAAEREAAQEAAEERKRRQAERGELDIFGLMLSPEQEAQLKEQAKAQRDRIRAFAESLDIFGLELPPEVERQRRAEAAFTQRLQSALDQQRASRVERPEMRLRAEAARAGLTTLTAEQEGMLEQLTALRREQERLNYAVDLWRDLASGVGSAWTSALSSVAAGTATVSEAFRAMGQSILKTMGDIAANRAFQAVFELGTGLLTSALLGGGQVGFGPGSGFDPTLRTTVPLASVPMMAAGGVVSQPTLIMAGERGPEHIVPQAQMQAMQAAMQSGSASQGSQNVSVILVDSRAKADEAAIREQAKGHNVVVQEVVSDLSRGESSPILRALRTLQR